MPISVQKIVHGEEDQIITNNKLTDNKHGISTILPASSSIRIRGGSRKQPNFSAHRRDTRQPDQ